MNHMITVCEQFAANARLLFNPQNIKLLCYNVKSSEHIFVVLDNHIIKPCMSDVHLGYINIINYININLYDRNIREHSCKFTANTNSIFYGFDACDSDTWVDKTYCMDLYGCELSNMNSKYVRTAIIIFI